MVSFGQKDRPEKPLPLRYAPDSSFLDRYRKEDIEVVEFSLLGALHALPKSEIKDIISCKPYRVIPNAPDIVIGVAEHNDEVLPVLDLAMVFGRRSLSTPEWRMIQVVNGDFQALVLTETVFGERRLPQEVQRAVPILLPHHVVYGCYPAADTVRLILNVAALAMHFEKSLVQELLPALSTEMKQARAELVPSLLEESEIPSSSAAESEAPKGQHIPQEPAAVFRPVKAEEVIPILEQPLVSEDIETAPLSTEKEEARQEAEENARRETEEQARREAEAKAIREVEEQQRAEAVARAVEEERVRKEAEEKARLEIIERERHETEKQAKREAEAKALREAEEQQKAEAAALAAEEERIRREAEEAREAEAKARQETEERTRREAKELAVAEALRKEEAEKRAREEAAAVVQEAENIARREKENALTETTVPSTSFIPEEVGIAHVKTLAKPPVQWKGFVTLAIIGIVIVAVFYLLFRKPSIEVKEAKAPVETVQKKTKGPLVLTVPNGVPVGADEYSIKKGDTLWGISKRFTGDPFNYPSIAGENNIVDPDLIYPEQKVVIKKKER
jgi:chemotaxis signal transduction protein/nucleoid-associated protein YgaU